MLAFSRSASADSFSRAFSASIFFRVVSRSARERRLRRAGRQTIPELCASHRSTLSFTPSFHTRVLWQRGAGHLRTSYAQYGLGRTSGSDLMDEVTRPMPLLHCGCPACCILAGPATGDILRLERCPELIRKLRGPGRRNSLFNGKRWLANAQPEPLAKRQIAQKQRNLRK